MGTKKKIEAREIMRDIRSGMSDGELMNKYLLSPKGLRSAFTKLLRLNLLDGAEFYPRMEAIVTLCDQPPSLRQDSVIVEDERELARMRPRLPVPIYGNQPGIRGEILTISESGVGISGIKSSVGDSRHFVIFPEPFLPIEPITFEAVCLWVKRDARGEQIAGFEITDISQDGIVELRRLIRLLDLSEHAECVPAW